ncbi:MAG: hypothetical protein CMH46_10160 [Muricauda sp.]|nr:MULTISPECIES: DUF3667 domain-containing protein [unclassified Allomuricauda]MAU15889.1 hypothetical protein [Allomuricauda sp.]|tara:strand:- start:4186 stop:4968 length:783 start_codon:yes stop_codon:yes gene_type:complete
MNCKNCDTRLRTDFLYCPACGAKVIRNRITFKNLWVDFLERYFNLDNTFIRTFVHLFTKPEVVIEGYLQGIRRKYLNPISYIGIALTLSGIIVFLMAKSIDFMEFDILETGSQTVYQEKLMGFILDYQALIFIIFIPLMAISGWLCFDKKKYNFAERMIIFMYALAHFSLFSFIPSVLVLLFIPEHYVNFSLIASLAIIIYTSYTIIRISSSKGIALISRLFLFYFILAVLYLLTSILIPVIMLLIGEIRIEDFLPTPQN